MLTAIGRFAIYSFLILLAGQRSIAQIPFPLYQPISAIKTAQTNPLSPDPIFSYVWPAPKAGDDLEVYDLAPQSWQASSNDSFDISQFKKQGTITVRGTGDIRFDFGQTNAGWLEFDSDDLTDSVTLSISEYNEPAIVNDGARHRIKTLSPVAHNHTYRLELNDQLYEGVRFGWLHVLSHHRDWHIKNFRLVCQVKPVNYQGAFSGNDSDLTRIWYTGAYTVKLNLCKNFIGAILMERSDRISWTGDAYPSQAASLAAFGNFDMVRANLQNTAAQDNGIASYSLYWVLSLIDYVNYSGDTAFAQQYMTNACKKLDKAYDNFEKPPHLNFYGWDERLGAGFEHPDNPETQHAYAMLSIRAWKEFGELLLAMNKKDIGNKYIHYAKQKITLTRRDPHWYQTYGLFAAADAINTGLLTDAENAALYQHNFTNRVNRYSFSPFNEFFVIQAMAKTHHYSDALLTIKDYWGGQIAYGGTTFFEVYNPSWNQLLGKNDPLPNCQAGYTSLTHPWSAGVTKWLQEEIAGIKPVSPGFRTFTLAPHLAGKLNHVSGKTHTPNGDIAIDCDLKNGITVVDIPAGTAAEKILIPAGSNSIASVFVNNKKQPIQYEKGNISFRHFAAGHYLIRMLYKHPFKSAAVTSPPVAYAINSFKQDSTTHGNWRSKYGNEGTLLFNYFGEGRNLLQRPAYIDSIHLSLGKYLSAPASSSNAVLTDTSGQPKPAGAYATKDPVACLQTLTIDVRVNDHSKHQLSLYFLDWDNKDRRTALQIFNLATLQCMAPDQLIDHYTQGKYLSFNFSESIRIRIDQVRGENASVAGLFFDKP